MKSQTQSVFPNFQRLRYFPWTAVIIVLGMVMASQSVSAQQREEIEEKKPSRIELETFEQDIIKQRKEEKEKKAHKLLSSLELAGSYETNPRLSAARKGDESGHVRYSLVFKRPVVRGLLLSLNYNFDGTSYSDINDLSNILNHTRMSLEKSLNKYLGLGFGYDFSSFYYPHDIASDFYFHKGFFFLKHNLTKKSYHQLMWEEGLKDYIHSRAYEYSTTTYQDKDRRDFRHGAEYSLSVNVTEKMFIRFRTKYSINDSNAFYQDYHDYNSWDFSPFINYRISDKYSASVSLTVTDKQYKSRLVAASTDAREDTSLKVSLGLKCSLNAANTVSLGYQYDRNESNDPTTEYVGNTFNTGWQYRF